MAKPAFDPSQPFEPAAKPAFDPGKPFQAHPPAGPEKPGVGETRIHHGLQGITIGAADEIGGAQNAYAQALLNLVPDGALDAIRKATRGAVDLQKAPAIDAYRSTRSDEAQTLKDTREAHPNEALASEVVGAVLSPVNALGGGATFGQAVKTGMGMGAAYGFGASEADLTSGKLSDVGQAIGDTVKGGAFGGAGGGVGNVIGQGVRAVAEPVGRYAGRQLAKAKDLALGRGAVEVDAGIDSLRGIAGGQTQKGSRIAENIRRMPGSDRLGGNLGASINELNAAAAAAEGKAAELMSRAASQGADDLTAATGALVSRGSRREGALKAKQLADQFTATAQRLRLEADNLASSGQPKVRPGIKAQRDAALDSQALRELEDQVLAHNLDDLPGQAAAARASREAYVGAMETREADILKKAQDILSGKAAWNSTKEKVLRYGPPAVATVMGSAFGGPVGALAGGVAGLAAGRGLEALAGAGMRPALRSLINHVTKNPAVMRATWGPVQAVARSSPDFLGRHGAMLAKASSTGGEHAALALHISLLQTDEEYAAKVAQIASTGSEPGVP